MTAWGRRSRCSSRPAQAVVARRSLRASVPAGSCARLARALVWRPLCEASAHFAWPDSAAQACDRGAGRCEGERCAAQRRAAACGGACVSRAARRQRCPRQAQRLACCCSSLTTAALATPCSQGACLAPTLLTTAVARTCCGAVTAAAERTERCPPVAHGCPLTLGRARRGSPCTRRPHPSAAPRTSAARHAAVCLYRSTQRGGMVSAEPPAGIAACCSVERSCMHLALAIARRPPRLAGSPGSSSRGAPLHLSSSPHHHLVIHSRITLASPSLCHSLRTDRLCAVRLHTSWPLR
jgi:hypothetical protein